MSKIANAFKNGKAFIGFITGGDPSIEKSEEFIYEIIRAGADLIEIGIPFSDPIAEGTVIQMANNRALLAGATTDKIFGMIESVRKKTDIPIVFLTYLNPVRNYGYENFFAKCEKLGIDGIIIPDMPFEEKNEIMEISKLHMVDIVSLVAPTSEQRIKKIVKEATGFIYLVSSMGVTGVRSSIETDLNKVVNTIKESSKVPIGVGFGINTPKQATEIANIADGVIVGSAIVKLIEKYGFEANEHIYKYVKEMKSAIE